MSHMAQNIGPVGVSDIVQPIRYESHLSCPHVNFAMHDLNVFKFGMCLSFTYKALDSYCFFFKFNMATAPNYV